MNCQDNSRLKVPLPEVCRTADIGCVPKTNGKPACPPEADQLPLAYDSDSKTLWIFSCESRQWVSFGKFSLSELQEISLDNIRNICSILRIPVFYNPGSGTIEGYMSLGDFASELLKCINLKPNVVIGSGGTVTFSVDGLDSLDPLHIRYENLTVSGKGTQADPLVIKAPTPTTPTPTICALPEKTQAQLEAATKATLGACLDNENVRVPYPEQPKNYTIATQSDVDGAVSRFLVAVIGGQHRRIPFPEEPCEYDTITAENATKATQSYLIGCVNNEEVKFSLKDLIDIIRGEDDPVADLNYSCVPVTTSTPSGAPDPKVGPFLLDGDGKSLWIWSCGDRRWIKVTGGTGSTEEDTPHAANWSSVSSSVSNKCTGVTYDAWYADGNTLKPTRLTGTELGTILKSCLDLVDTAGLNSLGTELRNLINALGNRVTALENGGSGSGTDLGPLTTRVTTLEGKVGTLETDVAGLKTDVAGLKTDVAGLKTDVAGLKTLTGTHTTQISGLTNRIAQLENNQGSGSGGTLVTSGGNRNIISGSSGTRTLITSLVQSNDAYCVYSSRLGWLECAKQEVWHRDAFSYKISLRNTKSTATTAVVDVNGMFTLSHGNHCYAFLLVCIDETENIIPYGPNANVNVMGDSIFDLPPNWGKISTGAFEGESAGMFAVGVNGSGKLQICQWAGTIPANSSKDLYLQYWIGTKCANKIGIFRTSLDFNAIIL